jgi:spore coat protein U-like protein
MNKIKILLSVFAMTLIFTMQGIAQTANNQDDITASATVLEAIQVTGTTNLSFGDVLPGVNKSAEDAGAEAGLFTITGNAGSSIDIEFTSAPGSSLAGTGGAEGQNLTIEYAISHADESEAAEPSAWEAPYSQLTVDLHSSEGEYFVFVGGEVEPVNDQAAGTYEETITLQVVYTDIYGD